MYPSTEEAFRAAVDRCKDLFLSKAGDYGGSWRLFRLSSLADQIFIKARRIRRLEEMPDGPAVPEGADDEYRGIFNYAVMALMRLWFPAELPEADLAADLAQINVSPAFLSDLYDRVACRLLDLLQRKNHDYGEAWRSMRLSSITDQILVRVVRLKSIEDRGGQPAVSEGADANYADIANYCAFALIRMEEGHSGG